MSGVSSFVVSTAMERSTTPWDTSRMHSLRSRVFWSKSSSPSPPSTSPVSSILCQTMFMMLLPLKVHRLQTQEDDDDEEIPSDDDIIPSDDEEIDSDEENASDAEEPLKKPVPESSGTSLKTLEKNLQKLDTSLDKFRSTTITKWYNRTRLLSSKSMNNTDFSVFEKGSILGQIQKVLGDEEKLVKKVRTNRSGVPRIGHVHAGDSVVDNEIFDDSDFYQTLLKKMLESRSSQNSQQDGADMTRSYMELQMLRYALNVLRGLGSAEIARRLQISSSTVRNVVAAIKKRGDASEVKKSGRPRSVNTRNTRAIIKKRIIRNDGLSLNRMASQLGIARSTVQSIVKNDLKLKSYKLRRGQYLSDKSKAMRLEKCRKLLQHFQVRRVSDVIWTDEKIFTIEPLPNRQNQRHENVLPAVANTGTLDPETLDSSNVSRRAGALHVVLHCWILSREETLSHLLGHLLHCAGAHLLLGPGQLHLLADVLEKAERRSVQLRVA
uniref:AATF-Che1 domain-containing protein n=1 Tax=Caenorhabditis japonica TaxID=281687 RepID=A0A8R1ESP7_CAEJA